MGKDTKGRSDHKNDRAGQDSFNETKTKEDKMNIINPSATIEKVPGHNFNGLNDSAQVPLQASKVAQVNYDKLKDHVSTPLPNGRKIAVPHNVEMQEALKSGEQMLAKMVAENQRTGKPVKKYAIDPKTGKRCVVMTVY